MAEVWKEVDCYGDIGRNYEVSSLGRLLNKRGQVLKPHAEPGRYVHFVMKSRGEFKGGYVHRMVCAAFHGPQPEGMEVAHQNGDAHDNRAENLRWKTHHDNMEDRRAHGTIVHGEAHHNTTIDAATAARIREAKGAYHQVGKRFGVSRSVVGRIKRGETWRAAG